MDVNWNMIRFGEGLIGFFLHVQCNIEIVHDILIDFNINLQVVVVEDGLDLLLLDLVYIFKIYYFYRPSSCTKTRHVSDTMSLISCLYQTLMWTWTEAFNKEQTYKQIKVSILTPISSWLLMVTTIFVITISIVNYSLVITRHLTGTM